MLQIICKKNLKISSNGSVPNQQIIYLGLYKKRVQWALENKEIEY